MTAIRGLLALVQCAINYDPEDGRDSGLVEPRVIAISSNRDDLLELIDDELEDQLAGHEWRNGQLGLYIVPVGAEFERS